MNTKTLRPMQPGKGGLLAFVGPWWLWLAPASALIFVSVLGYKGLNGQDAFDYLRIAEAWTAWWSGGPKPVMVEHPHGFPLAGALLGGLFRSELLGLRVIGLAGLVVIIVLMRGLLRRAFSQSEWTDAFIVLAIALCPFLLRYAMAVMSDVPAIALVLCSFAATVRWVEGGRAGRLLLAIALAVCALTFRLAVAPVIGVLACWWVQAVLRWSGRTWTIMSVAAIAILAIAYSAGIGAVWWNEGPLADWSLLNFFRNELRSDDGVLHYTLPNIVYVASVCVHPGFVPMGLLLLPFVRPSDLGMLHARIASTVLIGYLFFIAGMPFQNDRVLLMAQPFVAVLLYPAFVRAMAFLQGKGVRPVITITLLALLQLGLFVRAMLPFIRQAEVERELSAELNVQHATSIYTHGMGAAFGHYCPSAKVTELWYAPLEQFTSGAFVVVKPSNLEEQWKGRPPATNWERIQAQGVEVLVEQDEGWVVARVR